MPPLAGCQRRPPPEDSCSSQSCIQIPCPCLQINGCPSLPPILCNAVVKHLPSIMQDLYGISQDKITIYEVLSLCVMEGRPISVSNPVTNLRDKGAVVRAIRARASAAESYFLEFVETCVAAYACRSGFGSQSGIAFDETFKHRSQRVPLTASN